MRATFSDCFDMYATLCSREKNPLGNAVPAMGAKHVTLRREGYALQAAWIGQRTEDRLGQRLRIGAIHEEAMASTIDQFRQAVSCQSHHWRARNHGLEIDLTPRIVEHCLPEHRVVAIKLLRFLPRP